uniref:Protein MIZU-KUSSEI 1 n=1 Tax=Ananas comosus var. bracteatus TaxID=296719 RepID=A0A6V7PTM6_ANACO|nr:unnamed protein product [Ananas comosus var. bracteatus]
MRTIMARSPHDASFSFSKRHFQWIIGRGGGGGEGKRHGEGDDDEEEVLGAFSSASSSSASLPGDADDAARRRRRRRARLRRGGRGRRRPARVPRAADRARHPTSALVREMASGLVRIALECERGSRVVAGGGGGGGGAGSFWKSRCGARTATARSAGSRCGASAGRGLAGPPGGRARLHRRRRAPGDPGSAGEMMYMRARFERVVGSRDSEAFYMMNPDHSGGPELSIYLLRV